MPLRRRSASVAAAAVAAVAAAACTGNAPKRAFTASEMVQMDPLPLAKGSKWTYAVTVKRFDVTADKEITRSLTWTTEVIDAREGAGVTAYRIKGWPSDLASEASGDQPPVPSEKTLLRSGNSFLWGTSPDPTLEGAQGWFSWPVIDGQKICPSAEMVYCWQVSAVETGYALSFLTGPDEQTIELEPGTGVSRFHYAHHGTTNEVEAKLVSYSKSGR